MINPFAGLYNLISTPFSKDTKKDIKQEPKKLYFTYDQIHKKTQELCEKVTKSGINIDYIIAIGTGGFIPGRIAKTCLGKPLQTVILELYNDTESQNPCIKKNQWITQEFAEQLAGKNVLVIDEIDDTRTTLAYCTKELKQYNLNKIVVGVLHNKEREKQHQLDSDIVYLANENIEDVWVVYPWEIK